MGLCSLERDVKHSVPTSSEPLTNGDRQRGEIPTVSSQCGGQTSPIFQGGLCMGLRSWGKFSGQATACGKGKVSIRSGRFQGWSTCKLKRRLARSRMDPLESEG